MIDSVLQLARREVGVQEVGGNNRGRRVEEYLAAVVRRVHRVVYASSGRAGVASDRRHLGARGLGARARRATRGPAARRCVPRAGR